MAISPAPRTSSAEQPQRRGLGALRALLMLAIPLSVIHYTDNFVSFDIYPTAHLLGRHLTPDAIWIGWIVFTAAGLLGYRLYRSGRTLAASAALAFYSISGLISIGHYAEPGMARLAWWRHVAIWIDVALGTAVLMFALWSAQRTLSRRRKRPT